MTVLVLLSLVAAFAAGRLFQWTKDAQNIMGPPGRHHKNEP